VKSRAEIRSESLRAVEVAGGPRAPGRVADAGSDAAPSALVTGARERSDALPRLDTASAFRRYAPYVAKIGMRILGRRDEIDDFVQDVFVAVHRHLGSLREPAALKGWLGKLAVHEATRRLRRRRFRSLLGLHTAYAYDDVADEAASPEQRALLARVFKALDALPASDRVAYTLRQVEGETMERIALLCGCSLSTAKRRVANAERALDKLGVSRG
jgi:RNA polymerase sigma-70 factor (ECF subfamily)